MNRISDRRWKHPVFSLVFQAPDSKDSGRNRHTYKLVLGERLRNSRLKLGRPDRRGGGGLTHGRPKPPSCLITLVGGNAVYLRPKRLSSVTGHRSSPGLPYSYRPASMSSVIIGLLSVGHRQVSICVGATMGACHHFWQLSLPIWSCEYSKRPHSRK